MFFDPYKTAAKLGRWTVNLSASVQAVQRQAAALQGEATAKMPEIRACIDRLEKEAGPSERRDAMIGELLSLAGVLGKLAGVKVL